MQTRKVLGMVVIAGLVIGGCGHRDISKKAPLEVVQAELAKLAPLELQCDLTQITASEKEVLKRLVQAGRLIDELFLLQVSPDNPKIRRALQSPQDQPYLELFTIMFGPWNRLDQDKPFINEDEKPLGAGFYPADITREEFTAHLKANPQDAESFMSNFTVIQRQQGKLVAVPYHQVYREQVDKVSSLLREAAELSEDPTLQTYLQLRAEAFQTDDYFASDMAWMDLAGNLEVVIGPYEVYEDKLFNAKAAYEAFICIVDHQESEKLAAAARYLNDMEANLPIADRYKNFNRGTSSPIKVVQELFSAGDTKAGVQTTAFNLPNDERVREAKGSKKVMLKNIAQAKFEKSYIPIVNAILAADQLEQVSFDAYFTHVLMHEISHGLGPGIIALQDGSQTTVQKELKELYSVIEECKADVLGIINMHFLMGKGIIPTSMENSMYASYLGGMFRSIRFGIEEAHGGGVAIQFNYLLEHDAFKQNNEGKLTLNSRQILPALNDLASELLTLQAEGDYPRAQKLVTKYRQMTPVMQDMIERLQDLPVDIRPSYPAAELLMQ